MAVMLRGKSLPKPILQGGMGIGVSLDRLAGAVAACGGMGTISTAMCGYMEPDFHKDPNAANMRALERQVRCAKEQADGAGLVAVNVMVAGRQYAESVLTALRAGADAVVCGAGLPKDLPELAAQVPESDAALGPVVSSGRAAALLCRLWEKRGGRVPDFIVLEGPLAGGHLGFTPEEARQAQQGRPRPLSELLAEVLEAVKPFCRKYSRKIPVFVAGGVKDGAEMARYMREGAAGAQFATRFIATEECDASPAYKQALINAGEKDITIVQSPVGMPGRALNSPLIRRVSEGTQARPVHCRRCLVPCKPQESPYCISDALIAAVRGDWENGLFFCGANAGDVGRMSTVKEQIDQIMREWRDAQ
ncbi:MAG: nitronate monooxygenase family protein [Oscillospiraceae bacterium]|nr:nitronate monooxygenase family protein [Oscillospiraceae bacterium]